MNPHFVSSLSVGRAREEHDANRHFRTHVNASTSPFNLDFAPPGPVRRRALSIDLQFPHPMNQNLASSLSVGRAREHLDFVLQYGHLYTMHDPWKQLLEAQSAFDSQAPRPPIRQCPLEHTVPLCGQQSAFPRQAPPKLAHWQLPVLKLQLLETQTLFCESTPHEG
jgi:hypothetical protein